MSIFSTGSVAADINTIYIVHFTCSNKDASKIPVLEIYGVLLNYVCLFAYNSENGMSDCDEIFRLTPGFPRDSFGCKK